MCDNYLFLLVKLMKYFPLAFYILLATMVNKDFHKLSVLSVFCSNSGPMTHHLATAYSHDQTIISNHSRRLYLIMQAL